MKKNIRITSCYLLVLTLAMLLFNSCDGTRYVSNGDLLLTRNTITLSAQDVSAGTLSQYVRQSPNTKWFSSLKIPLGIYSISGADTTRRVNRLLRRWGEAPVIYDSAMTVQSMASLRQAMQNMGYLDADVSVYKEISKKRIKVHYNVVPHEHYTLRSVTYNIADPVIDSLLRKHSVLEGGLKTGLPFSVNSLYAERTRITSWLAEHGYVYFNKEAITFHVDSSRQDKVTDVVMNLGLFRQGSNDALSEHPRYYVRNVSYHFTDSIRHIKSRTLDINTVIRSGEIYQESHVQRTYSRFARLGAVRSTNIRLSAPSLLAAGDSAPRPLDADIYINMRRRQNVQIQPEGTNTAGDFGAALSLTYENRNVFKGCESFSLLARGAFEAIRGLEGYQNDNYTEYNFEGKLVFPEFVIPGISRSFQRRHNVKTELVASYNRQNRPEFHRRVFTTAWRYKWQNSSGRTGYQYDFLDLDYVSMPWISDTFKRDYLDSSQNRNAILRYNYENLLIMKMGFGITYNDGSNFLKTSIETAGNTLAVGAHLFNFERNADGQYKFALVAFAQYIKFDIDYTRLVTLDHRNSLALHARCGVAVPYGNSTILPFDKRYFSGGANSVRGWSVRELGPGGYRGTDGRIDFINQTGDFRLDLNAELRSNLFWKFQGALFIDAGNVWTLRGYADQPGGRLTLRGLYDELAVAYGLGLRLNFNYFILRLDLGMKAVNPVYTNSHEHFPITNINFTRDYALHFAVGLPF